MNKKNVYVSGSSFMKFFSTEMVVITSRTAFAFS